MVKSYFYGGLGWLSDPFAEKSEELITLRAFKFRQKDSYLVWKVVARESDEVLMKWEAGGLEGTTWFHIPSHENVLVFGSSFPLPSTRLDQHTSLPAKLYQDASRNLPEDAPVGLRLRSVLVKGVVDLVTQVHVLYSKYLLLSTYNKILEEEQKSKERGEF